MEGVETALRRRQLGDLRRADHADLDRRGRLVPRLLHQPRRHDDAVQHACSARSRPAASAPGLYGMLILAVITVFVAGLMVGRTPEYLGKKISAA